MRIKTQLTITIVVFSLLLIIIGTSILMTSNMVNQTRIQERLANNVLQSANDLTYLSNDYVIYHESLQLDQWWASYNTFSSAVGNLSANTPEQQELIQNIQNSQQNIKLVFDSTVASLAYQDLNANATLSAIQVSWSRMSIQSQELTSSAIQLAHLLRAQVDQLNAINFSLIFGVVTMSGVFLGFIYFQTFQRTLKSVSNLQTGAAIIGSGNLDYKINDNKKDEIGELSAAFNQMTSNLKMVTASKTRLESEIAERKKVEEALLNTKQKLEENAVQLEEYASQMEKLAVQRANQLKDAERLAAIGATAGMVGHDIRNPLQAIISDIFLAKSELTTFPESEEKKNILESLDETEKNIDYINKIVQDLQDYARPLNPKTEETNLKQLLEKLFTKNGLPKNTKVSVKVAEDAKTINADSYYLNRIMYNLVTNAVQAMPNGGYLTIQAYKEVDDDIVISVEDTGVGIPKEIQNKMFTVMFTTKSKGQGFGLPVVKRMTESLGGTVTFESQEGKGTTFQIRLPPSKS